MGLRGIRSTSVLRSRLVGDGECKIAVNPPVTRGRWLTQKFVSVGCCSMTRLLCLWLYPAVCFSSLLPLMRTLLNWAQVNQRRVLTPLLFHIPDKHFRDEGNGTEFMGTDLKRDVNEKKSIVCFLFPMRTLQISF